MKALTILALSLLLPAWCFASDDVIISEVVSDNTKFQDEDTDTPDWIELRNNGDAPVDLTGWMFTTSESAETTWTISGVTLAPKSSHVFFASSKNRPSRNWQAEFYRPHTDFRLEGDGGYVALLDDSKQVVHALTYPELSKNLSYGCKSSEEGYFFPATPGEDNGQLSKMGLSPEVVFSHKGGLIPGTIELTMEVPGHPEASIQYGLNGTEPSIFTPSYKGPVTISESQWIIARAVLPDHLPSRLTATGFLVMDESLTAFAETGKTFESNLPIIVIDSAGENLETRNFKPAYVSVTSPDPETGRAVLGGPADYAGPCAVHLRGESSAGFGQKSFALELQDADGEDHDAGIAGMPADSDWAMVGPWSEKSLMRNKLIFDWMLQLRGRDGTAMRSSFCEVFVNQRKDDPEVSYDAYQGIYLLVEKIKRGRERVPIDGINSETIDPDMITGGYIIRKDKTDSGKTSWSSAGGVGGLQSFAPDKLNSAQQDYIKSYLNNFEKAVRGEDRGHPTKGYRKYIDPDTFIDAQWFVELAKQVDGYVFSTYWHKPRNGKLRAGPLWDFNISLGNADYATGDLAKGWLYNNRDGHGQIWYPFLHDDPEYNLAHWDRYWHMRQSFLSDDAVKAKIAEHMNTLLDGYVEPVGNREPDSVQNPVARHFRRHPHLGSRQWPNPLALSRINTWQEEVGYMENWFLDRLDWLDSQTISVGNKQLQAPRLSAPGGVLESPKEIAITLKKGGLFDASKFPQETLYYTTDGSDPRLTGGELNPDAREYAEPISINAPTTIQARVFHEDTWSPKVSATYLFNHAPASADNLIVSEIMYHPSDPAGLERFNGFTHSSAFEYIELTNTSASVVDLSGVHFTRGVEFKFDSLTPHQRLLGPGQSIILVKDPDGFARRHGDVPAQQVLGQYQGKLSNDGESITLANSAGEEIVDVEYNDGEGWPVEADGGGFSLIWANDPDAEEAAAWKLASTEGGDPGNHTLSSGMNPEPTPDTDTDGDGLNDLLESLLGSDPNDSGSAHYPDLVAMAGDAYQLRQQHGDLNGQVLVVESSPDLIEWTAADLGAPESDGNVSTWTFEASEVGPEFLRIRIEP